MASAEEMQSVQKAMQQFQTIFGKMSAMFSNHHKNKPGDVYISTFPKSGTNLLRQMVYQVVVAAGGGPEWDREGEAFKNIDEVVPMIEMTAMIGKDSNDTVTNPRLYGTHLLPEEMDLSPAGTAKVIYCFRNPEKIPSSMLDFMADVAIPGVLKTNKERELFYHMYVRNGFLKMGMNRKGTTELPKANAQQWFESVKKWTDLADENMLVLSYEGICRDIRGAAQRIATFLGLNVSDDGFDTVVHRCSRSYMLSDKFKIPESAPFLQGGAPPSFVRAEGDTGFHSFKFDDEEKKYVGNLLRETFNVDSYAELVEKKAAM